MTHLSSTTAPAHHSNAAQNAFDWNTPAEHAHHSLVADIPKVTTTSKRKAEQSAPVEQSSSLNLSTSIDTEELEEQTPTRVQSSRSAKRQHIVPRRRVLITAESDDESSESPAF
ncbi:hypothetical protein V6N13_001467 [Hibiscus sabdariffa]